MAIETKVEIKGITINDAYLKIDFSKGSKSQQNMRTRIYVNKEMSEFEDNALDERWDVIPVSVEDEASNFIKQGYKFLKEHVYPDAVDC